MSVIIISNASGGGGGMVDSVTAGDDSIVIGGTASDPTIETGTLDEIAALHPPVAAVAMNGEKITGLANGTAATDAAAFGQIPTSAATIGGLLASNNLSDVSNEATALANLGGIPQKVTVQTLASAAASITFSSIPAGYNLLRLVVVGRSAAAAETDYWYVQVNGDTGAHYDTLGTESYANVSTNVVNSVKNAADQWWTGSEDLPGASATAGIAGRLNIEVPDYAGTTFQKVGHWESGYSDAATSAGDQAQVNGICVWRSTAAITSVTIFTGSGSNLVAGTTAYLYLS